MGNESIFIIVVAAFLELQKRGAERMKFVSIQIIAIQRLGEILGLQ